MKKILVPGLALTFFLLFTTGLRAQKLYLGIQVGYSTQKPSLPNVTDISFDSDASFFYGFRAGVKFMNLALEANYLRSAYELIQKGIGDEIDWDGKELNYSFLGVNLKFFPFSIPLPPIASLHPYATAGYGIYGANIKDIKEKDNKGGYNVGAGLELKISKLSLLAELKYRHGKVVLEGEDVALGNFSFSAGVNLYF